MQRRSNQSRNHNAIWVLALFFIYCTLAFLFGGMGITVVGVDDRSSKWFCVLGCASAATFFLCKASQVPAEPPRKR